MSRSCYCILATLGLEDDTEEEMIFVKRTFGNNSAGEQTLI